MMPTLLYVATRWPYPVRSGRARMIAQTLEMASKTHRVVLAAFCDPSEIQGTAPAHIARAVPLARPGILGTASSLARNPVLPLQSHLFRSAPVESALTDLARREAPDVIMLDMIRLAPYARSLREARPNARVVLDMDDLLSRRYAQMRGMDGDILGAFSARMPPLVRRAAAVLPDAILAVEGRLVARAENRAIQDMDAVVMVSPREASILSGPVPSRVHAVPPAVPDTVAHERDFSNGVRFVFLGDEAYAPNEQALRTLQAVAKDLGPVPRHVSFESAGRKVSRLETPDILRHGFVDDLDAFLGPDAVMVAPIITGTGIKTKLLDAMARGVPVITTSRGAEGLALVNGRDILVTEVGPAMLDVVRAVASGEMDHQVNAMGMSAARRVAVDHSYERINLSLLDAMGDATHPVAANDHAPVLASKGTSFRGARDAFHSFVLALADAAAFPLALAVSFLFAGAMNDVFGGPDYVAWDAAYASRMPVLLPLALGIGAWLHGRGRYGRRQPFWTENKDFLTACLLGFVLEGFVQYAMKESVSRLWTACTWATLPLVAGFLRAWMRSSLAQLGVRWVPVLVVGEGDGRVSVVDAIRGERSIGWTVSEASPPMEAEAVLLAAARSGARHVVLVGHPAGPVVEVMRALSAAAFPVSLCLPAAGSGLASMRPDAIVGQDFVLMGERPGLSAPLARAAKRCSDVALAIAIGSVALPVAAVIAAVVASDGGPVLYGQVRVGRGGREFRCLKFRTMVVDSQARLADLLASDPTARVEWERDHKLRRDPRVTRWGGMLRASALDEIPQLLNVLRGDMSFVGPRPVTEPELERYGADLPAYLGVRPGLTGLWQASGRNDVAYERRVALDAWYVKNWSAWLDVVVVLKTVPALLMRRGAY